MKTMQLALIGAAAMGLAACAADDPHRRAKTGAVIGAVVGGVLGHQVDDGSGRYVGAAVGALAGAAVGNYMDKQHEQLQRELAAEAARNELQIRQLSGDALLVGVASDYSFDIGRSDIKPEAFTTYAKIASVLRSYDRTVIHVVGHTDSSGSDALNQDLSEKRADAVARYMASQGLQVSRMRQEGRGEREPVASNDSPAGRTRNRRVDIVIKPVVEGQEARAWDPPPYLGG